MLKSVPSSAPAAESLTSPRQSVLLSIIAEVGRPISTTELARLVDQSLGATAHHVRALARQGLIEWAGERRVRGALQTFYIPSAAGLEALRAPRLEALLTLFGAMGATAGSGDGAMTELDEGAQVELRNLMDRLRPEVELILARAAERQTAA